MNPLVSIVCVTEDRPAFWPWLYWNLLRQTYRPLEFVLVDSSQDKYLNILNDIFNADTGLCADNGILVKQINMPHRTTVDVKYNNAIAEAQGEFVQLWGDDDWQHPQRTQFSLNEFQTVGDVDVVSWNNAWFFDIWSGKAMQYYGPDTAVASLSLVKTESARTAKFMGRTRSDTHWMQGIISNGAKYKLMNNFQSLPSIWLVHKSNISKERTYNWQKTSLTTLFGDAFEETARQIDALRIRLLSII